MRGFGSIFAIDVLVPVPGSQPRYNKDIDLQDDAESGKLLWREADRIARERKILEDWMRQPTHASPFVLVRTKVYDKFVPSLDELAVSVFRESDLDRNELILLRLREPGIMATQADRHRK